MVHCQVVVSQRAILFTASERHANQESHGRGCLKSLVRALSLFARIEDARPRVAANGPRRTNLAVLGGEV